jgi:hypothetical protein
MARQNINIGSSANDGTGDPLRTAFDKINDNFVELYGTDNDINTLDANLDVNTFAITTGVTNGDITVTPNGTGGIKLGAVKFVGTTMSSDDSTQITIAENIQTTGTLNVAGATTLGSTVAIGTSLALATGATVTGILDEDNMATNSATQLATQQSIKAYVDAQVTASDLDVAGDSGTGAVDLDSQSLTIAGGTGLTSVAGSQTVTLNIDSTVATLTGSQTLTNKVLTNPTINAATMTGAIAIDGVTIDDNTIKANASDADLELDGSGSGQTKILANATVVGTLNTADIATTGNQTISGSLTTGTLNVGDLNISADGTISTDTNGDINIDPAGTGAIVLTGPITATGTQTTTGQLNIDNLRLDGNTISATTGGITLSPAAGQNVSAGGILTAAEANFTLMEAVTVRADAIQNDTSNGDISISTQGTGNINVNSLKINNLADPTATQDAATKAYVDAQVLASGDTGDLTIDGSTITAPSNADLTLATAGTGLVAVNNLKVDGNIQINDNKIATTVSNSNLQLGANGSGKVELMSSTVSRTGDIIFDASSDIILDAGGKDIIFQYDGNQFGLFTYAGGNLLIQSGSTTMLTGDGANAIFNGNITVPGSATLDGVTITDNTISSNASNADLQIGTSGTGVIDLLTATQTTVGSAGGANALPGQPTGYIKVKIGGTMRVIPFYDES